METMETIVESSASTSVTSLLRRKSSSLGEVLKVIELYVSDTKTQGKLIKITRSAFGSVVKQNDVDRFSEIMNDVIGATQQKKNLSEQSIVTRLLLEAYLQDNKLASVKTIERFLPTAQMLLQ